MAVLSFFSTILHCLDDAHARCIASTGRPAREATLHDENDSCYLPTLVEAVWSLGNTLVVTGNRPLVTMAVFGWIPTAWEGFKLLFRPNQDADLIPRLFFDLVLPVCKFKCDDSLQSSHTLVQSKVISTRDYLPCLVLLGLVHRAPDRVHSNGR